MTDADFQKAQKIIETQKYISFSVFRLAKEGKNDISRVIKEVLKKHNVEALHEDIFYIIMELSFNAIKANYRYMLAIDQFCKESEECKNHTEAIAMLTHDQQKFEDFYTTVDKEKLKEKVQIIFNLENKANQLKALAKSEERELNETEKDKVRRYLYFIDKALKQGIEVHIGLSFDSDILILEVINDAPITFKGLKNIYGKRMTFKSYVDRGEEEMFYFENLDASESAGFGAAMIDSRLTKLGLDPFSSFEVIRLGSKTAVTVSLPFEKVKIPS